MYYIIIFYNFQNLKTVNNCSFRNHWLQKEQYTKVPQFSSYQLENGGIYVSSHSLSNTVTPGRS